MNNKVIESIKQANVALYETVELQVSINGIILTKELLGECLGDLEYTAFITGWLLAKGLYRYDYDLSKEACFLL